MKTPNSKPASKTSSVRKKPGRGEPSSKRIVRTQERRDAILAAALDEFIAKGFAAARLDDVATRAGVAKGTIYLHFKDKDELFQDLVRTTLVPLIAGIASLPEPGGTARAMIERFTETFVREIANTKRGDILRLIISEGGRFPSLSEFYYREVVERGIAAMRQMIEYGIARDEIQNKQLARFPQLVVAPAMVAIIWQGLFGRFAPLDAIAMLQVHIDLIFGPRRTQ